MLSIFTFGVVIVIIFVVGAITAVAVFVVVFIGAINCHCFITFVFFLSSFELLLSLLLSLLFSSPRNKIYQRLCWNKNKNIVIQLVRFRLEGAVSLAKSRSRGRVQIKCSPDNIFSKTVDQPVNIAVALSRLRAGIFGGKTDGRAYLKFVFAIFTTVFIQKQKWSPQRNVNNKCISIFFY